MTDFKLPELGENVSGGDVLRLLVKAGDTIANEQPVIELETDKATIEVPSSVAGTVTDLKVKAGDKVKVGQTILTVDDGQESKDSKESKEPKQPKTQESDQPKPQPVGAPEEGGLSQQATSDRGRGTSGAREQAREDRDGDRPGLASQQPQGRR